jgi:iron(III) transport system ATP-binding protein
MLHAEKITKMVPGRTILQDVSLVAEKGSTTALLGPSGSGKTTFLRVLMGLEEIDSGTVSYGGRLMTEGKHLLVQPHERNFGIVFQEFALLPHLNVYDNIAMAVKDRSRKEKDNAINHFLALLHIEDRAHSRISTLSGGEQQRVALARTLAANPDLILLDEPFSNLDKTFRLGIYDELKALLKERETTTILVTHDHVESFYFSDRVCVIKEGRIVQEGTPAEVYERPCNDWVASFVGDVNYLSCKTLRADFGLPCVGDPDDALFLIRPERLLFVDARKGDQSNGQVVQQNYMGGYEMLVVRLDSGATIRLKDYGKTGLNVGSRVRVTCPFPRDLITYKP